MVNPVYIIRNGIYQSILEESPAIKGDVLDVGCGSKPYESLFSNADSYIGVDVEVSGHDHSVCESRVDVFYDGKVLPFVDAQFDSVVCFEVLEHVFNVDELLREMRRVLKPDGLLLLSVPFAWNEHEAPYDFARYTSFGLTHLLERNGFKVLRLSKTTTFVLALCQMCIAYLYQHVFSRSLLIARLARILVFPLNIISLALNLALPSRYDYFCNCVVLASR